MQLLSKFEIKRQHEVRLNVRDDVTSAERFVLDSPPFVVAVGRSGESIIFGMKAL